MWDREKNKQHIEGVLKRIAEGGSPFYATDEELARSDEFWTRYFAEEGVVYDPLEHRQPWQTPPDWERLQAIRDEVFKSRPPETPGSSSS